MTPAFDLLTLAMFAGLMATVFYRTGLARRVRYRLAAALECAARALRDDHAPILTDEELAMARRQLGLSDAFYRPRPRLVK